MKLINYIFIRDQSIGKVKKSLMGIHEEISFYKAEESF